VSEEGVSVLMVCHANLCRSPMAERLARRTIADRLGGCATAVEVTSAGTHAAEGRPMHPYAAEVLDRHGAQHADFRSRRVTAALVEQADLVLTATREQRAACVTLAPRAVRRTFTLLQFGRLAGALHPRALTAVWPPQQRLRALVEELPRARGAVPVAAPEEDDLPDPVQQPLPVFRRCARDIQWATDLMVNLIAPI